MAAAAALLADAGIRDSTAGRGLTGAAHAADSRVRPTKIASRAGKIVTCSGTGETDGLYRRGRLASPFQSDRQMWMPISIAMNMKA